MCRGKKECSELDVNPKNWDKFSPLKPPLWIDDNLTVFTEAIDEFINGNREKCIEIIDSINGEDFCNWYIEHGQVSGRFRKNILNILEPKVIPKEERDPLRPPTKYQEEVFKRDGYHCRYCGNKLISQKVMKEFIKKLNYSGFQKGSTNLTTHGIIHSTWPVADHMHPWNMGGMTNLNNLVSSCASCNYGKDAYTVEQLGIENPFDREPINSQWDGLISKLNSIKNV